MRNYYLAVLINMVNGFKYFLSVFYFFFIDRQNCDNVAYNFLFWTSVNIIE